MHIIKRNSMEQYGPFFSLGLAVLLCIYRPHKAGRGTTTRVMAPQTTSFTEAAGQLWTVCIIQLYLEIQESFHLEYYFLCHGKWKEIAALTTAFHVAILQCLLCQSSPE